MKITVDKEVLEQALEALERCGSESYTLEREAMTAIRGVLAQPEQQWQSTADKVQIEKVPANGGLLPAQPEQKMTYQQAAQLINEMESKQERPAVQGEPVNKYCCHTCFNKSGQVFLDRMILCPECGNKRCPKATHHDLPCTNSNEPGQAGSIYTTPQPAVPDGLPPVVAGAVFDFAGYLTTRDRVIEVGATANASPVADLVKDWAALRGLSLADAAVLSWQEWLAASPKQGENT